jgi:acyl-CoA ligase (AMP-forming) (exosortase A-associated)
MSELLHELPLQSAERAASATALVFRGQALDYGQLIDAQRRFASGLLALGLERHDRVAVWLPKRFETVTALFGTAQAGGVFVPINPLLKPAQVVHILEDSGARILVTAADRRTQLDTALQGCRQLRTIIEVDASEDAASLPRGIERRSWSEVTADAGACVGHRIIDADMAALLYTSGSTGRPKGVVLSHRNMVAGAHSVAGYLENTSQDRLLAALPFSFDYGFSQLSTAFLRGASVVLMDYLLPRDILIQAERERVTGLAGVPPLWIQLAELTWPDAEATHLRYITNSGGAMPGATLSKLRQRLPRTRVYLMYGLTEAFRSTYLPPEEVDRRPDSIGKAIPNAEILVLRPDGNPSAPDEPGELVHRGALVALGYWNDPAKTAERFRPIPPAAGGLVLPELAVWSGDTVRRDADGYLYFIGRRDEMIKTSGYRVSPTEVEEVAYATGLVGDVVAVGVPHAVLGQAVVLVASALEAQPDITERLLSELRKRLPNFMLPAHVEWRESLPRNPNGKFDRPLLARELAHLFQETAT